MATNTETIVSVAMFLSTKLNSCVDFEKLQTYLPILMPTSLPVAGSDGSPRLGIRIHLKSWTEQEMNIAKVILAFRR
jgi:hypothetical protein